MAAITILDTVAANIATPSAGKTSIFVDADSLKLKTSTGNVVVIGGGTTVVESFNTRTGNVTLSSGDVTGALGFTPISGINSSDVTTALGYTPYDATNPAGYITNANVTLIGDVTASGNTSGNITTTLSNTSVVAGTYGDASNIPQITVDSKGRITSAGNVSVTIPPGFNGNLLGNVLYDSTTNIVSVQAYPINAINSITNSVTQYATRDPFYTGSALDAPSAGYQSIGSRLMANVSLSSGGGALKQTAAHSATVKFVNQGSMTSNDRTRGMAITNAIDLNGGDWGNDGSTSNSRATHTGAVGTVAIEGSGTLGHAAGSVGSVFVTPSGGGDQVSNYVSGSFNALVTQGGNAFNSVSTGTARLYSGLMNFNSGHTVTNAIGLHLYNNWAVTSGGASITNKYGILIEDANSPIQTASNIVTTANVNAASANITGNVVIEKAAAHGIQVDTASPSWGWRDILGPIEQRGTGITVPNFTSFIGNIYAYQFDNTSRTAYVVYHLPHDYVPGTDVFWHVHWAHNSTAVTSGAVTWSYEASYAKGFDQAPFSTPVTGTVTQTASTTQYEHMVAEGQLSVAGGSATQLNSSNFEVDGLIILAFTRSANTMTGSAQPFVFTADCHYQSSNMATKAKAPGFYG